MATLTATKKMEVSRRSAPTGRLDGSLVADLPRRRQRDHDDHRVPGTGNQAGVEQINPSKNEVCSFSCYLQELDGFSVVKHRYRAGDLNLRT
jgi:hypothetical protein